MDPYFEISIPRLTRTLKESKLRARRRLYKGKEEAKLPQSQGLSIKEQACFLWALCRYSCNPETCPLNLMRDLKDCPFEKDCENVEQWGWLPILENRTIPEKNR